MHELLHPYHASLLGLLSLAVLMAIQFVVADLAAIGQKHVPGMPVTQGHDNFFFRATRAYANTNENIGVFLVALLACVLGGADAQWTSNGVWLFVAGRAGHMAFYYAKLGLMRSVCFGLGALGTLVLIGNGFRALA